MLDVSSVKAVSKRMELASSSVFRAIGCSEVKKENTSAARSRVAGAKLTSVPLNPKAFASGARCLFAAGHPDLAFLNGQARSELLDSLLVQGDPEPGGRAGTATRPSMARIGSLIWWRRVVPSSTTNSRRPERIGDARQGSGARRRR